MICMSRAWFVSRWTNADANHSCSAVDFSRADEDLRDDVEAGKVQIAFEALARIRRRQV